jgi:hypothetical protein
MAATVDGIEFVGETPWRVPSAMQTPSKSAGAGPD